MLLKKVRLENFGRFGEPLERDFGAGINVVKGPLNEIGKSTFLAGVVTALFENPKSTKKELEKFITWGRTAGPRQLSNLRLGAKSICLRRTSI